MGIVKLLKYIEKSHFIDRSSELGRKGIPYRTRWDRDTLYLLFLRLGDRDFEIRGFVNNWTFTEGEKSTSIYSTDELISLLSNL